MCGSVLPHGEIGLVANVGISMLKEEHNYFDTTMGVPLLSSNGGLNSGYARL